MIYECNCDCTECFYRDDASEHPGCEYNCGHEVAVGSGESKGDK